MIQTADALEARRRARGDRRRGVGAEAPPRSRFPRTRTPEEPQAARRAAVERKEPRRERKPRAARSARSRRQRGRVVNFLVQVWAELRRVQWPDRNQVTQATGVVIVFCFIAGAYLAFWDFVFGKLVTSIL